MCIAFWYTATSPSADPDHASNGNSTTRNGGRSPYAFILLSNRDLELGRPAFDASFHDFEPINIHKYGASKAQVASSSATMPRKVSVSEALETQGRRILSGRDAADSVGGTWLGMGVYRQGKLSNGRVGVLTNIHDDSPVSKGTQSRGALLKDWLKDLPTEDESVQPEVDTLQYLDGLKDGAVKLAGFNLLLFDILMKDASPNVKETKTATKTVDRISAAQMTNRYRPNEFAKSDESTMIPADQSNIDVGDQARVLPASADPAGSLTSPLGVFQAAITELKPSALHMGGMSNSLLEEPFPKVVDGLNQLEQILKEQFDSGTEWDKEHERQLLERLFLMMSQSHSVHSFQDLELAICVPLCTIPLPTASLYHLDPQDRSAYCTEDENTIIQQPRPRKPNNPALHDIVNPHTLLGTPRVTPEASPIKPNFKASPSTDQMGSVPEHHDEPGLIVRTSEDSMTGTPSEAKSSTQKAPPSLRHYGTRLTTIILVKWTGEVTYVERDIWWQDRAGTVHNGGTDDRIYELRL